MKRSLIFCAVALMAVATANTVQAAVDVQLNLRYDNPADESAGGSFDLLILSDNGNGVAGVSVLIDNIDAAPTAAGAADTGFNVFETQTVGTVTEIVTGTDLVTPNTGVGLGVIGSNGGVADDLFDGNSPFWDGSALVATGTFGSTRPSFVMTSGTLDAGANDFVGTTATETTLDTMSVRGDGVATDGLLPGDANRDGVVDVPGDGFILVANLGAAGAVWDQGDFNSSTTVDVPGDGFILVANLGGSTTPPAISAVPEPSSALLALCGLSLLGFRRNRS